MTIAATGVPDGKPKSGRVWKVKQTFRSSAILRTGVQKNQSKTYEEKQLIREQKQKVLDLERSMRDDTKQKRGAEIARRVERKKRIMEAEYKNSSYQAINAEKLKTMSKKQLRMVRKTSMNKNGQIELVNPWQKSGSSNSSSASPAPKRKR